MKAWLMSLAVAVLVVSNAAKADALVPPSVSVDQVIQASQIVVPFDLINWKVGDTSNYQVSMGMFGKVGTMTKSVTKDEGASLWLHQDIKLQGQNEKVDVQINKADGKILKMIRNGQEQQIPDDKLEIISQDVQQVTVPAGTFKAIHVVAKTQQVSKLEVWANPRDTVMEGTIKQIADTGMFGDMIMELTSFSHGN